MNGMVATFLGVMYQVEPFGHLSLIFVNSYKHIVEVTYGQTSDARDVLAYQPSHLLSLSLALSGRFRGAGERLHLKI